MCVYSPKIECAAAARRLLVFQLERRFQIERRGQRVQVRATGDSALADAILALRPNVNSYSSGIRSQNSPVSPVDAVARMPQIPCHGLDVRVGRNDQFPLEQACFVG